MNAKINNSAHTVNCGPAIHSKNSASLDTLAQLASNDDFELAANTSKTDGKTLLKRARRKYMTLKVLFLLIDASKNNPNSALHHSYWNTYHCTRIMQEFSSGLVKAKYCKCKWCLVCNAIKTAVSINQYSPIMDTWKDMHFVTLTQKTVLHENLHSQIDEMQSIFRKITRKHQQRKRRGKDSFDFIGLRKLECTYRPNTNHYHPHYHVMVSNKEGAEYLLREWLERNPNADGKAQDCRPATQGAYKELFKYMTKIITKKGKGSNTRYVYALELDNIFNAFIGRRVLQPFGFKLPKVIDCNTDGENIEDQVTAIFKWYENDWVNMNTGELLSGYTPCKALDDLFK